jgi:hypothetical protein
VSCQATISALGPILSRKRAQVVQNPQSPS